MTPSERRLGAQAAAHASWAGTADPSARTRAGRDAFEARFAAEVDPRGLLSPAERSRRAMAARRAYFIGLALKSAKARRLRATGSS